MAFIDIFNFKKYFATDSDSQVARVGHVNQLARRVTEPTTITVEVIGDPITCNAYCAKINIPQIPTESANIFEINNSLVKADSLVFASVGSSTMVIDRVVTTSVSCDDGFMTITVVNSSTDMDLDGGFVNFLIIN